MTTWKESKERFERKYRKKGTDEMNDKTEDRKEN